MRRPTPPAPGRLPRLSADDLVNLWVDEPGAPFQIALVGIFDGGPFLGRDGGLDVAGVQDALAARAGRVDGLGLRLVPTGVGQGLPLWAADPAFRPRAHVTRSTVPPGTSLEAWCAARIVLPLDPGRPLWRAEVVDGLSAGRFAVVVVVHHAVADGLRGVALAAALLDQDPDAVPPGRSRRVVAPLPSGRELALDWWRTRARSLARAAHRLPGLPGRLRALARQFRDASADFRTPAPATSLSRPIGPGRRLAVVAAELEQLRSVGTALGATVNDVLLAAVTGGLRALLLARGDRVDGLSLRASVPVGATGPHQPDGMLVLDLPVGEPDPVRRLVTIRAATTVKKARLRAGGGDVLDVLHLPVPVARWAVRAMRRSAGRRVNLFVTNVPGPATPLWLAGARLLRAVPVAPLVRGVPLGVAALSYAGTLCVSINADAAVTDVDVLAAGMRAALAELDAAARTAGTATPQVTHAG